MNSLEVDKGALPGPGKVRVLFLDHVSRAAGGAQRSLLDLVKNLPRERYAVVVSIPAAGAFGDALAACGAQVVAIPMKRFKKTLNPLALAAYVWSVLRTVPRLIRRIRRDGIDVVHANGNSAHLYGMLAGRLTGVPAIWHCRDLSDLGLLGRLMYRMASRVVTVSQAVAARVARYGGDAGRKIRVVYNGIAPGAFQRGGSPSVCRREWGIGEDAFLVAMIGQVVPWKNHGVFLEAARRVLSEVPHARFVVVGGDMFGEHGPLVTSLRARVAEWGLESRIIFAGFRDDIGRVLDSVDLLLHPADREPFGRVVLEAMAAGKPVVAVGRCGPAEIIRQGVDGVLTREADPGEMAEAVIRLAGDAEFRGRIAAAARERARKDFPLSRTVAEIEGIYNELAGSR